MPKTPLQYKQIKDERKLSILNSALVLFALDSEKISIDKISQSVQCSHGLIYHYFKNTDEILFELKKSDTYLNLIKQLAETKGQDSPLFEIESIIHFFIGIAQNKSIPEIAFATMILSEKGAKSLENRMIKLIKKGQQNNIINGGNPADLYYCFMYLFKGIYLEYLTKKKPEICIPSIDNIMNIFKRKIRSI